MYMLGKPYEYHDMLPCMRLSTWHACQADARFHTWQAAPDRLVAAMRSLPLDRPLRTRPRKPALGRMRFAALPGPSASASELSSASESDAAAAAAAGLLGFRSQTTALRLVPVTGCQQHVVSLIQRPT